MYLGSSLKKFVKTIENRIPPNIKIVAEIRLMWEDVVGGRMAKNSRPAKCEYLPDTGSGVRRRLVVNVKDDVVKTAMTTLASEFLDRIPPKYKIKSIRFQRMHKGFAEAEAKPIPKSPDINLDDKSIARIKDNVENTDINPELKKTLVDFLVQCKIQEDKK